MSTVTEKTVREIAVERPQAIRVFEKFGIDYCCGGAKPLDEVCAKARLNVDDVLAAIEALELKAGVDDLRDWSTASLESLVKHIEVTHHAYVQAEIPRLQKILDKVESVHGQNHPQVGLVNGLFNDLAQELTAHMAKEEEVLFPYVVRMERAVAEGKSAPAAFFGTVRNPTAAMMDEHEAAGGLLKQIRTNCDDFKVPADVCTTFRAMYQGLEDFERDLHQHIHLENNILFPRALRMEEENAA
jgi:regulator of cell morphogenesis and NO signaling